MDTKISGNELLTANGQHGATIIQSIRASIFNYMAKFQIFTACWNGQPYFSGKLTQVW